MYVYNPTPAEKALLELIGERESGNNYGSQNPISTASGRYNFIDGTWKFVCNLADGASADSIGQTVAQYPKARLAPPQLQDAMALLLLRLYGPNSSKSWKASGPYPTFQECKLMLGAAGVTNP